MSARREVAHASAWLCHRTLFFSVYMKTAARGLEHINMPCHATPCQLPSSSSLYAGQANFAAFFVSRLQLWRLRWTYSLLFSRTRFDANVPLRDCPDSSLLRYGVRRTLCSNAPGSINTNQTIRLDIDSASRWPRSLCNSSFCFLAGVARWMHSRRPHVAPVRLRCTPGFLPISTGAFCMGLLPSQLLIPATDSIKKKWPSLPAWLSILSNGVGN
jgi:hypothetical protein